jgi:hypothetical protein
MLGEFKGKAAWPESICTAASILVESARKGLRNRVPELVYKYQFHCSQYLARESARFLEEGDLNAGTRALDTLLQVFPDTSEQSQRLISARNQLTSAMEVQETKDVSSIVRAGRALRTDPWLAPISAKIEKGLLSTAAAVAVSEKRIQDALRLIAAMDFQRRTTKDHELVTQMLTSNQGEVRAALGISEISSTLRSYSLKDEQIKNSYVSLLDKSIFDAIDVGDEQDARKLLDQLLAMRPDPSTGNDALRIAFVEQLLQRGEWSTAEQKYADIQTGAPLSLRLRLFIARVGIGQLLLGGGVVMLSSLLAFVILNRRWGRLQRLAKRSDRPVDSFANPNLPPRRFVVYSHGIRAARPDEEYFECLDKFKLEEGATLPQIKLAYRNAVKSCHPDLNPNAGPSESARFIDLTKTYEKLLSLHAKRTGEH